MRVILTSDVDNIGLAGEIKTVRKGLARNYLFPQKLAIEATRSNLRDWEKKLEALKEKREKTIADAQAFADKIEGTVISIETKLSQGQKMFGSVNVNTIEEALKEQHGIEIEKKNILLEKNIKSVGRFDVPIRVKAQIKTSIVVQITAEEDEEEKEAQEVAAAEAPEETAEAAENVAAGEGENETEAESEEPAEPEENKEKTVKDGTE